MKKMNKKGFTLAELLIVVAIIAVLVAIAIPVFTAQLEKSKESTDMANVRSAYAEVVAAYLTDNNSHTVTVALKSDTASVVGDFDAIAGVTPASIIGAGGSSIVISCDASGNFTINDTSCTTTTVS